MTRLIASHILHWIGTTICLWSVKLQGTGPGPWSDDMNRTDVLRATER